MYWLDNKITGLPRTLLTDYRPCKNDVLLLCSFCTDVPTSVQVSQKNLKSLFLGIKICHGQISPMNLLNRGKHFP